MTAEATKAPAMAAGKIVITGDSLYCVSGDATAAAWSAVAAGVNVSAPEPTLTALSPDGAPEPVMAAGIQEFESLDLPARLHALVQGGLARMMPHLPRLDGSRLHILLLEPDIDPVHAQCFREIDWRAALAESDARLTEATLVFSPISQGATAAIVSACDGLREGKWDALIVGGIDSLVDVVTCAQPAYRGRWMTESSADGLIAGEASAFLLFERECDARERGAPARAYLAGAAVAPEPNTGLADRKPMTGLTMAIRAALAQAGLAPSHVEGILLSAGQENVDCLEWYQITQQLWPRRISEQQRTAVMLGEIDEPDMPDDPVPETLRTAHAFGEVGAATVPLQLVLGLEWFRFDARFAPFGGKPRKSIVICETGLQPRRGAIALTIPQSEATN